ncbi:MAG: RNA polymerase sigma factor [Pseudomonadota bacterium]
MSASSKAQARQAERALEDAEEKTLLVSVARGDRAAFDQLYRRYYPRLRDFIARMMPQKLDAVDEVLNDTMYVVWTKASSFRQESRLSTWIFGIAYRKALKHFERENRARLEQMPEEWVAQLDDASDHATAAQLQDSLEKAINKLPTAQRSVVELTYEYGYSYAEIAEIVGCPENTVKTRMFHARDKLRKILETLARWEK